MPNLNDFRNGTDRPKRVLLLEDDSAVRDALADALRLRQHLVVSIANLEEALKEISGTGVDVALIASNGLNGRAWRKAERLASTFPNLVIILLASGHEAIPPVLADRARASFQKPLLDLDELIKSISEPSQ